MEFIWGNFQSLTECHCVAYSPNGAQIASGSDDNTVRLWDAKSGAPEPILEGHTETVSSVVYSPSGTQIASASEDKMVRLWDAKSGAPGPILQEHSINVGGVAYSQYSAPLASGCFGRTTCQFGTHSNPSRSLFNVPSFPVFPTSVSSVVYSPSGAQIALGSYDQKVRLWDVQSETLEHTLQGHTSIVTSVVYSPSGAQIASGSHDKTVRLWDAHSGAPGLILKGHADRVNSVVYSPGGAQIASGSHDKTVRLWEVASGACLGVIQGFNGWVTSVAWKATPEGSYLLTGSEDKSVRQWEIKKEGEKYKAVLYWSSGHEVLTVRDVVIEDAQGLSEMNARLLRQRGATGNALSLYA